VHPRVCVVFAGGRRVAPTCRRGRGRARGRGPGRPQAAARTSLGLPTPRGYHARNRRTVAGDDRVPEIFDVENFTTTGQKSRRKRCRFSPSYYRVKNKRRHRPTMQLRTKSITRSDLPCERPTPTSLQSSRRGQSHQRFGKSYSLILSFPALENDHLWVPQEDVREFWCARRDTASAERPDRRLSQTASTLASAERSKLGRSGMGRA